MSESQIWIAELLVFVAMFSALGYGFGVQAGLKRAERRTGKIDS